MQNPQQFKPTKMSTTPRTDAAEKVFEYKKGMADFARTLETELAQAQAKIAALLEPLQTIADMPEYDQDDAHRLRHQAKQALPRNSPHRNQQNKTS